MMRVAGLLLVLALASSCSPLGGSARSVTAEQPSSALAVTPADAPSPLNGLEALQGEFPISLRFRGERNDGGAGKNAPPLTQTQATFATETDGALDKMLRETARQGSAGQQALAQALPTKLMLEHFNFGQVSLELAKDFGGVWPFSPCHFAYLVGCLAADLPGPAATSIHVADATKFRQGDAVLLLPLRAGQKLWASSEYAAVTAIEGNTLRLKRAAYGSKVLDPKRSAADQLWVAPLPLPYTEDRRPKAQLTWNWSTLCPRDEQGRQASDAFAEALGKLFAPGGALSRIHGFVWDVPRVTFRKRTDGRMIDADLDGKGDDGFQAGVNTYALGAVELDRKIRAALSEERLFLSDGYYGDEGDPRVQLPGVFNGLEHDINSDHQLTELSSLLNIFTFYQRYVQRPHFSLLVRKDRNLATAESALSAVALRQNQCMKNALATILGIAYGDLSFEQVEEGKLFSAADETQCGREDRLHWLGRPAGPIIRPAFESPDTLVGAGVEVTDAFLARWTSANSTLRREGRTLLVSVRQPDNATSPDRDSLLLTLRDLPVKPDCGLLIQFEVRSEKLRDFASDVPRIITVTPQGLPGWPEKKGEPRSLLGWSTSQDFTPVSFYFREPAAEGRINIQVAFQGRQNVTLRNFVVRAATDVLVREFKHGVVLCNPGEHTSWTFDLAKQFPGVAFRRIAGSAYDTCMAQENNGATVGATVTLAPQTGLFLVKVTPNSVPGRGGQSEPRGSATSQPRN